MGLLVLTCIASFPGCSCLQFLIALSKTGGRNSLGTSLYMHISPSNSMASGELTCSSMEIAKSTQSGHPRESSVWDYFIYDGEKHKSICQIGFDQKGSPPCDTEIAGKYTMNATWRLIKHAHELAELAKKDAEKEKTKELKRKSIFQCNRPADYSRCSCLHKEVHSGKWAISTHNEEVSYVCMCW